MRTSTALAIKATGRQARRVTSQAVVDEALTAGKAQRLHGGRPGLSLIVRASGAAYWLYSFQHPITRRMTTKSLGRADDVSGLPRNARRPIKRARTGKLAALRR
jgi:hypothetical protein